ncbi:MAG: tyrosine-type recombinase/integrase [Candidatus Binataceae bacterium]
MARRRGNSEGSIYQRKDGRWCGVVDLGWENGKRKRKSLYGTTRKEVAEALNNALREKEQGFRVAFERQTVKDFLELWLTNSAKGSTRPRTFERYGQLVHLHIIPTLGTRRLEKLTVLDVQHLLNDKLSQGLAPKTVRHIRGVLATALGRALKWGLVHRNAAALTEAPRAVRSEIRVFSSDEARRFVDVVKGERLEALYLLAVTLGVRRGEVLGLKWQDVDFEAATIDVRASLQRVNGNLELSEPKTKRSRRQLPLLDFVARTLRTHKAHQSEERLAAGSNWQDMGFVFATRVGTPVDPANLLHDFKRMLRKGELPDIRFHDLRHSAASRLVALNVHPRVVMELLGHSQISLTMDTYSHVVPDLLREAVGKLGAALQ